MAYLLRPWTYRYTKDGKRVPKGTPGAKRVKERARKWYGSGFTGWPKGKKIPLASDKETAKRMLRALEQEAEEGILPDKNFLAARKNPLEQHLEDFGQFLSAKGNTEEYVKKTLSRCRAILEGIGSKTLGDLQPSAVLQWLASLRQRGTQRQELPAEKAWFTRNELIAVLGIHPGSVARMLQRDGLAGRGNGKARRYARATVEALQDRLCQGIGVNTSNHYLTAIKVFTRWLVKDGRQRFDPLDCLSRQNTETDIRVKRRALPPEQFAAFLNAARQSKNLRDLTGTDRAVLYALAARTGLRASELASLTPASFDFAASVVIVEAAYSKRRRRDEQPLPPDIAAMMKDYIGGRKKDAPLWPGSWAEDGAEIVRHDLDAAGIAYIDEEGHVYDFHALRHQFITDMVESGVHPKDAQALARHSTITLTMDRYTHVRRVNLQAALDRLPSLNSSTQNVPPAQDQQPA